MIHSDALRAVGYIPFNGDGVGFALPVFGDKEQFDILYVQELDEATQRIEGFRRLDSVELQIIPLAGPLAKPGSQPIYAFVSDDGIAHVGSLEHLKFTLQGFATRHPDDMATQLQISELIGSNAEKKIARDKMQRSILIASGAGAAHRFYEGSLLRSAVWRHVARLAHDRAAFAAFRAARPRIKVRVDEKGQIDLDLSALDLIHFPTLNRVQLVRELEVELDEFRPPLTIAVPSIEPGTAADEDENRKAVVHSALRSIYLARKQEERLAILLRLILTDRNAGRELLVTYSSDKAGYASRVIQALTHALDDARQFQRLTGETNKTRPGI